MTARATRASAITAATELSPASRGQRTRARNTAEQRDRAAQEQGGADGIESGRAGRGADDGCQDPDDPGADDRRAEQGQFRSEGRPGLAPSHGPQRPPARKWAWQGPREAAEEARSGASAASGRRRGGGDGRGSGLGGDGCGCGGCCGCCGCGHRDRGRGWRAVRPSMGPRWHGLMRERIGCPGSGPPCWPGWPPPARCGRRSSPPGARWPSSPRATSVRCRSGGVVGTAVPRAAAEERSGSRPAEGPAALADTVATLAAHSRGKRRSRSNRGDSRSRRGNGRGRSGSRGRWTFGTGLCGGHQGPDQGIL